MYKIQQGENIKTIALVDGSLCRVYDTDLFVTYTTAVGRYVSMWF